MTSSFFTSIITLVLIVKEL
ncbi:hypothetical protein BEYONPHE_112 [Bacillus phage Beyonphe]|nr:hypothetical protein BEYONPHE_112 [Bacillus phage Beyonphe]